MTTPINPNAELFDDDDTPNVMVDTSFSSVKSVDSYSGGASAPPPVGAPPTSPGYHDDDENGDGSGTLVITVSSWLMECAVSS
jgi:hypothetical protein